MQPHSTEKLLKSDNMFEDPEDGAPIGVFTLKIGHIVVIRYESSGHYQRSAHKFEQYSSR
jgi:hypothetical protein